MHWPLLAARILVVTATAGFRHDSIPVAEETIRELATARGVEVEFARNDDELREHIGFHGIDAVFFINTTGELSNDVRDSLLAWVMRGGTFVGIHSATDTWHTSPEYIEMIGAEFVTHPPDFEATIIVEDASHPATRNVISPHVMLEEIYSFGNLQPMHVLMTVDGAPVCGLAGPTSAAARGGPAGRLSGRLLSVQNATAVTGRRGIARRTGGA